MGDKDEEQPTQGSEEALDSTKGDDKKTYEDLPAFDETDNDAQSSDVKASTNKSSTSNEPEVETRTEDESQTRQQVPVSSSPEAPPASGGTVPNVVSPNVISSNSDTSSRTGFGLGETKEEGKPKRRTWRSASRNLPSFYSNIEDVTEYEVVDSIPRPAIVKNDNRWRKRQEEVHTRYTPVGISADDVALMPASSSATTPPPKIKEDIKLNTTSPAKSNSSFMGTVQDEGVPPGQKNSKSKHLPIRFGIVSDEIGSSRPRHSMSSNYISPASLGKAASPQTLPLSSPSPIFDPATRTKPSKDTDTARLTIRTKKSKSNRRTRSQTQNRCRKSQNTKTRGNVDDGEVAEVPKQQNTTADRKSKKKRKSKRRNSVVKKRDKGQNSSYGAPP